MYAEFHPFSVRLLSFAWGAVSEQCCLTCHVTMIDHVTYFEIPLPNSSMNFPWVNQHFPCLAHLISTVWCSVMMPVTYSQLKLWIARLLATSEMRSRTKRDPHLIMFLQTPSFSGKFKSLSTEASLRTSVIAPSAMKVHCCPWTSCQRSSQTLLLKGTSISS